MRHATHNSPFYISAGGVLREPAPGDVLDIPFDAHQIGLGPQSARVIRESESVTAGEISIDLSAGLNSGESVVADVLKLNFPALGDQASSEPNAILRIVAQPIQNDYSVKAAPFEMQVGLDLSGLKQRSIDVFVILANRPTSPSSTRPERTAVGRGIGSNGLDYNLTVTVSQISDANNLACSAEIVQRGTSAYRDFIAIADHRG
jgi:hypothetical protein